MLWYMLMLIYMYIHIYTFIYYIYILCDFRVAFYTPAVSSTFYAVMIWRLILQTYFWERELYQYKCLFDENLHGSSLFPGEVQAIGESWASLSFGWWNLHSFHLFSKAQVLYFDDDVFFKQQGQLQEYFIQFPPPFFWVIVKVCVIYIDSDDPGLCHLCSCLVEVQTNHFARKCSSCAIRPECRQWQMQQCIK